MSKILITGGTGFLGKRLGARLIESGNDVVLTGRNNKQNFSATNFSGVPSLPMDVSQIESVRDIFTEVKPEIVIHAAATKFVDLSEKQPMETIDVNVVGSQNVARVAIDKKVNLVLGISTDKASPPVRNTYGLTKALMERMFCAMDGKSNTKFMCVRYGNVAWSTGSVLCIWRKMLREKGVIGTTGPEMYRFFFTVDEAVELVLTALENFEQFHGMVLSRKMKAAQMKDFLRVWTQNEGGTFEEIQGRPGERNEEYLFGELELPYTEKIVLHGIDHYLISFNKKASNPVKEILSSSNTEMLLDNEILEIIQNPPFEEI
ncbi:MAG: SDR family NAD(P)-dependent oxidoreductase [Bacillota bacterium]|jgi:FlaA1/EpsC-like NDP-sugar epimerase